MSTKVYLDGTPSGPHAYLAPRPARPFERALPFPRVLRCRLEEVLLYASSIRPFTSAELQPVVIFGQGRTGSTLLESLLDSTGYFRSRRELLNTGRRPEARYPMRLLEGERKRSAPKRLLCHVKPHHLSTDRRRPLRRPELFLQELDRSGWKILHLTRHNKFEHAMSSVVAEHRGFHKHHDNKDVFTLEMDCDDLIRRMRERAQIEQEEREMLGELEFLDIGYEEDLSRPERHQQTVDRVLEFLSLETRSAMTSHRKVNARRPDQIIANYDEVVSRLTDAGFGSYLP